MNSNLLIHEARDNFNIAIANRDVDSIQKLLIPSYHIVTGRSVQNHGAESETRRWADLFRDDSTAIYRRIPGKITINESWELAEELGNWKVSYSADKISVHSSGVYAAKWHRTESGEWMLQAEMFTTLTCTGPESGCMKPDPIE